MQASGRSEAKAAAAPEAAVMVVGGTGGLGAAICRRFAAEGRPVFLTYRSNQASAERLTKELIARCDVASASVDLRSLESVRHGVEQAVGRFGAISVVVYASGARILQPFVSQISPDQWDDVIQTELMGFINLTTAVLPVLRERGEGALVSIVTFATYAYPPGDALSAVPKAAVEMLTKAIAKEEGRNGIRANAVAPGIINAGLGELFQKEVFNEAVWDKQRRRVPLRRFGEAEEVADAVAFLASDRARYITGQTLIVDGGLHL